MALRSSSPNLQNDGVRPEHSGTQDIKIYGVSRRQQHTLFHHQWLWDRYPCMSHFTKCSGHSPSPLHELSKKDASPLKKKSTGDIFKLSQT